MGERQGNILRTPPSKTITCIAFAILWVFVFAIPLENMFHIPGGATFNHLIGLMAFGFGGIAIAERGIRPMLGFHYALGLFAVWEATSYAWAAVPGPAAVRAVTFVQLACFAWLIWQTARSADQIESLTKAFVFGSATAACLVFWQYVSGISFMDRLQESRFVAPGTDPNELAITLAVAFPLAWLVTSKMKNRSGILLLTCISLFLVGAIVLTGSRSGVISLLGCCFAAPAFFKKHSYGLKLSLALILAITSVAVGVGFSNSAVERLSTMGNEIQYGDLDLRLVIWRAGIEVVPQHPWIGVGAAGYETVIAHMTGRPFVAHNTLLSILVETGGLGLALFVSALFLVFLKCHSIRAHERSFWFAALAVWGIGMVTLTWEFQKTTWFLLSLLVAQAHAVPKITRRFLKVDSASVAGITNACAHR